MKGGRIVEEKKGEKERQEERESGKNCDPLSDKTCLYGMARCSLSHGMGQGNRTSLSDWFPLKHLQPNQVTSTAFLRMTH